MQADTRLKTSRTARALYHRRLANTLRQKLSQPGTRVKTGHSLLGAVHHQANPFDGQTGFSDIGRQHHLTLACRRGQDRFTLFGQRQRTVERAQQDIAAYAGGQLFLHALDLAHTG